MLWNRNRNILSYRNRNSNAFTVPVPDLDQDPKKHVIQKWRNQKLEANFLEETMLLLALKKQDFVQIFCCWKTVQNSLDPEQEPEPDPEPNFFKVGTGTAINYNGSTTLQVSPTGFGQSTVYMFLTEIKQLNSTGTYLKGSSRQIRLAW